jgi:hypothetical protein
MARIMRMKAHQEARLPRLLLATRESTYRVSLRSRSAFKITDTELNVIARLAIIGLSRMPNQG